MSISAITGSAAVQQLQGPPKGRPEPPPMTNTADLLGMTTDELRDAQKSGTTLTDLAAQKGVSKDDLVKSLASDLKANKPDGAPELTDDQLTEMATNIADGKRPQGPPPPPRAQQSGDQSQLNLQSLAEQLGVSASDLLEQLTAGTVGSLTKGGSGTASTSTTGGLMVDQYA